MPVSEVLTKTAHVHLSIKVIRHDDEKQILFAELVAD